MDELKIVNLIMISQTEKNKYPLPFPYLQNLKRNDTDEVQNRKRAES